MKNLARTLVLVLAAIIRGARAARKEKTEHLAPVIHLRPSRAA